MKKPKKNKIGAFMRSQNRENAKEQGFYDGRFKPRVIKDKRKQVNKDACKKWNDELS